MEAIKLKVCYIFDQEAKMNRFRQRYHWIRDKSLYKYLTHLIYHKQSSIRSVSVYPNYIHRDNLAPTNIRRYINMKIHSFPQTTTQSSENAKFSEYIEIEMKQLLQKHPKNVSRAESFNKVKKINSELVMELKYPKLCANRYLGRMVYVRNFYNWKIKVIKAILLNAHLIISKASLKYCSPEQIALNLNTLKAKLDKNLLEQNLKMQKLQSQIHNIMEDQKSISILFHSFT